MSNAISSLHKYIKEIHIGDNRGEKDDHILPYDGNIDWEDFLRGLTNINFGGALCFELSPVEDYFPVIEKIEEIYREWQGRLTNE
jgi:sugar phosphate isomerase/epimerase